MTTAPFPEHGRPLEWFKSGHSTADGPECAEVALAPHRWAAFLPYSSGRRCPAHLPPRSAASSTPPIPAPGGRRGHRGRRLPGAGDPAAGGGRRPRAGQRGAAGLRGHAEREPAWPPTARTPRTTPQPDHMSRPARTPAPRPPAAACPHSRSHLTDEQETHQFRLNTWRGFIFAPVDSLPVPLIGHHRRGAATNPERLPLLRERIRVYRFRSPSSQRSRSRRDRGPKPQSH